MTQGELPAACLRFQEGYDIVKRLTAADLSSASLWRDVWVSLWRLTAIGDGHLAASSSGHGRHAASGRAAASGPTCAATRPTKKPANPAVAPDVFVSYKREDELRVAHLVRALEKAGLSVWWDRALPRGESWRANIEAAPRWVLASCR